jgi:hypothetical protein
MVSNNELLELTSVEMRRRIGTKEISPVELLEVSIARIEALNPHRELPAGRVQSQAGPGGAIEDGSHGGGGVRRVDRAAIDRADPP